MRQTINGADFRRLVISAAASVEINKQKLNELNVFPVPDGDTGTNMSMTLQNAARELSRLGDDCSATQVADVTASAVLRGARGNSGVITSLLFRGFSGRTISAVLPSLTRSNPCRVPISKKLLQRIIVFLISLTSIFVSPL